MQDTEPASLTEALDNLSVRAVRREKRRLLSALGVMALLGVSLALLVLWQRDATLIRKALQRVEPYRLSLESAFAASGQLPLVLPRTDPDGNPLPTKGFTYLPSEDIRYLRDYEGSVMVGFTHPMSAAIRPDGRAVILCRDGRCEGRWMTHTEVAVQRKEQEAWIARRQEELLKGPSRRP